MRVSDGYWCDGSFSDLLTGTEVLFLAFFGICSVVGSLVALLCVMRRGLVREGRRGSRGRDHGGWLVEATPQKWRRKENPRASDPVPQQETKRKSRRSQRTNYDTIVLWFDSISFLLL